MSFEKVVEIGKLALKDEKLRNELLAAVKGKTGPQAAAAATAFAKAHGYDVTQDEVVKGYEMLVKLQKGGTGELSDEELSAVAGGDGKPEFNAGEFGAQVAEQAPEIAASILRK